MVRLQLKQSSLLLPPPFYFFQRNAYTCTRGRPCAVSRLADPKLRLLCRRLRPFQWTIAACMRVLSGSPCEGVLARTSPVADNSLVRPCVPLRRSRVAPGMPHARIAAHYRFAHCGACDKGATVALILRRAIWTEGAQSFRRPSCNASARSSTSSAPMAAAHCSWRYSIFRVPIFSGSRARVLLCTVPLP